MCGIVGAFGKGWSPSQLHAMIASQRHRGPDAEGYWIDEAQGIGLGHNRLAIIDLSEAGRQPMWNASGTAAVVFNGEIYNYLELREELGDYAFRNRTDTEVILAAWERWGEAALDRFSGMFSFLLWDAKERKLFAARDRFGVKPLYYHLRTDGVLFVASEIKALHRAGVPAEPDTVAWSTYLTSGISDLGSRTFWSGVSALPAGSAMTWQNGRINIRRWYDLGAVAQQPLDERSDDVVAEEYLGLLRKSVGFRFRSDVPVGINLSGGLDSSLLLGLVHAVQGEDSAVKAYTFVTGDPNYDESPWVQRMLDRTQHPSRLCLLTANDVPKLAASVQEHSDEPFGGIPTLAYARVFEQARADGTIVLLDGQGMDEQWAGYDYYAGALNGNGTASVVQGSKDSPLRKECVNPGFAKLAETAGYAQPFNDKLRNLQYRDACVTKIPRALRFNDRVSMRSSTELREPFLDHELFEFAFRQPAARKIAGSSQKWLLRKIAGGLLPSGVVEAPKRPVQTPQREWLRGPLKPWAADCLEAALSGWAQEWLDPQAARSAFKQFIAGQGDNSFFMWQWISIGMMAETVRAVEAVA